MKISGKNQPAQQPIQQSNSLLGAKDKLSISSTKESKEKKNLAELGDASKVSLSQKAQKMNMAKEVIKNQPDVDEAKVAKFQEMIDAGKYKVDAKAVADKMVDEHLMFPS